MMIISLKDSLKMIGISIIVCCAVFVCTLFLNYNIDLGSIKNLITTEEGIILYNAQVSMGKVTIGVTGGCLVATSIITLLYYIKNYFDDHDKELGILKALGYSNFKIAKHFYIFGLSVFLGALIGYFIAFLYLPNFYKLQNADGIFPEFKVKFHPLLVLFLIIVLTLVFMLISILYAIYRLRKPVLFLLYKRQESKVKIYKESKNDNNFLKSLSYTTLKSKKSLVFFVIFSSFCFSAMIQMAISMRSLSSESFAWMVLLIGLILAFVTIFLSLSNVVKGNTKTIAMMRVMGYQNKTCSKAILGVYRPISYIGFVIGTIYQYALLKLVMTFVFSDLDNMPEYNFDFKALAITFVLFIITYEVLIFAYSQKIKKLSFKSIMLE